MAIHTSASLHAAFTIFFTALYSDVTNLSIRVRLVIHAILWLLPPQSPLLALWFPSIWVLSHWPLLLERHVPRILVTGGPLGPSCKKVLEVIAGLTLWRIFRGTWPPLVWLGDTTSSSLSWQLGVVVLLLSGAVNLVLWLWSTLTKSRGNHRGVNDMVKPSVGRRLSLVEHAKLLAWAVINAICEEVTARGLWRTEFELVGIHKLHSNLCQAIIFGAWHYNGIPSGFVGVGLTLVYGLIMGFLADYTGGSLLLPVLAHSIADYFIFAFIARSQSKG